MNITVNGKEYILEYTFEAAECHECIDAAMDIFGGMMTAKIDSKHSEEMQVRDFLMSLSDLPRMAMDMFYAGLLENHGTGQDGDGTITSRADARCLYKQFCKENPEDERATSYYALCTSIAEQMEKDGFSSEPEWKTFWRTWRVWSRANRRNSRRNRWIISGRSQPKRRKQQWKRERRAKKTIFRADLGRISAKSFAVWLSV